ncbi:MAG TPA: VTT domain-containing protein [Gemmatimonadales bacterium]
MRLLAFFGITIFVHGPLSPFLPTAYEATLLYYARSYPAWLLALIGTVGATLAEAVNYRVIDWVAALPAVSAMKQRRAVRWSVNAFLKAPFWATAFVIFTPLPDSAVRVLAPLARYPIWKFLGATAVGRLPRFLLIAGFGWLVRIPPAVLLGGTVGMSLLIVGRTGIAHALGWLRRYRAAHRAPAPGVVSLVAKD